jgi:hypothetical protein
MLLSSSVNMPFLYWVKLIASVSFCLFFKTNYKFALRKAESLNGISYLTESDGMFGSADQISN